MGAIAEPDRARSAAHLLHGHAVLEVAETAAAVVLLHGDAVQAQRAHLRPELTRKTVGPVDLLGERRDLLLREAEHRVAQHVGDVAQPEIETRILVLYHGTRDLFSHHD